MNNYILRLRKGLQDQKIENLTCITSSNLLRLRGLISDIPDGAYISEWRYGMGDIKYEYHIHVGNGAKELKEAYESGAIGGHPKLTGLYSKEELRDITSKFEALSEPSLYNQ